MQIAKKFKDFDAKAVVAVQYIQLHFARLRIPAEQVGEMLVAFNNWTQLWYQYIDGNQRTPTIVRELETARRDLDGRLRGFRLQVKNDRSFEKTEEDKIALKLDARW